MIAQNDRSREKQVNFPEKNINTEKIPLLVVAGPTAIGKTALAIALCEALRGEVVSADSMQVYQGMDIATAKPSPEELARVPQHLIGVIDPNTRFSVARYAPMAHAAIRDIYARGRLPVLCGGTGLYIQAVTENLSYTQGELTHEIPDATWQRLHEIDPAAAANIHPNDQKRVSHALALYQSTGTTLTQQNLRSRDEPSPYRAKMIFLNARDRQALYDRVDARVDTMMANGLLEEAKAYRAGDTAAQAIGHKELEPYFRGERPLEEAVETLKRETRRYAKRQLSWLRRMAREWNTREPHSSVELLIDESHNGTVVDQALDFMEGFI